MEQTGEKTEQKELYSECQKLPSVIENSSAFSPIPSQKLGVLEGQHLQTSFASFTPEKANESSHVKSKKEACELPEKYRILSESFDRLTCSIRLLTLCKRPPTFQNISAQVQRMTGRTFQHRHLAQMKYILPEAIKTEKILMHDKKTLCMKPYLNIALDLDGVETDEEPSTFIALSNLFVSRLRRFFSTHPEVSDIPEAELPDLFNQMTPTIATAASSAGLSTAASSAGLSTPVEQDVLNSSHFSPSFCRHFSRKDDGIGTKKAQLSHFPHSPTTLDDQDMETNQTSVDLSSKSDVINSAQLACGQFCASTSACPSTPLKLPSESDNITLETPAQLTPKRSVSASESKHMAVISENNIASSLTAKRSLDFSHLENEENISNLSTDGIQQSGNMVHGFAGIETEGDPLKEQIAASPNLLAKVEENYSFARNKNMTNQRRLAEHHQASVNLSDLVPLIHQIFESASFHSITKEELIHKIIMNNCDIDEDSDIEGQIEHLGKLVPDWISKKFTPSGDLLYSIKKVSDLNFVRERLISI